MNKKMIAKNRGVEALRGVEPLTMIFFLRAFSPRVLRRDRTDEQKFSKSSN